MQVTICSRSRVRRKKKRTCLLMMAVLTWLHRVQRHSGLCCIQQMAGLQLCNALLGTALLLHLSRDLTRARVRGSQGADNPAAGPRPNAPRPPPRSADTGRATAGAPVPCSRQTSDLDIVGQSGATPFKLSFGALLQEASRCRQDLRYFLDRVEGIVPPNAPAPAQARPAAPRQTQQGQGPTPMETHFETEVACHADYSSQRLTQC